jgi:iron-sulfur cluster repair protein YtfE (RIC family)
MDAMIDRRPVSLASTFTHHEMTRPMNHRDDSSLQASEVATRILAEHALLRPILRETRLLADRVAKGDEGARAPLRAFALMLYEKLVAHIELEDRILAPAVRNITGWGPSLHTEMMQEHARQRAQLKSDIGDLRMGCICEERLANSIDGFVESLMRDMEAEEKRLLLRSDLLADSLLGDGESG